MNSVSSNNRRLLKNTLLLYGRMFLTMGIGLMTPRLLLRNLGAVDYGLVNVIGSVISMCIFFSGALGTASSRFLNFEMEKGDPKRLHEIFSQIVELHFGMALLTILLGESFGLWYFYHKLNIPAESVANGLSFLHMSNIITALNILIVPYTALLIAHENMKVFSLFSIIEACLHFFAAFLLRYISADRLGNYGHLYATFNALLLFLYCCHALKNYPESRIRPIFSRRDFKDLLSFSTWNALGTAAWASSEIFISLLLNAFFGPIVNAARGIAMQIFAYTGKFTQNFLTASRPQIVKYWATGKKQEFEDIICMTSRLGYLLLLICTVPLILEMPKILRLWLTNYPDYSVSFARLTLICGLINFFSFPIVYGVQATGRIALFESLGSGIKFLTFPIAWLLLRLGMHPDSVLIVNCAVTLMSVTTRLAIMVKLTGISAFKLVREVYVPLLLITVFVFAVASPITSLLPSSLIRVLAVVILSSLAISITGFFLVLKKQERVWIKMRASQVFEIFRGKSAA